MARKRQCKSIGFQKGLPGLNRGLKYGFSIEKVQTKYVRCTKNAFEARVNRHLGTLTFLDVDGSETNLRPLRPSGKVAGISMSLMLPATIHITPTHTQINCTVQLRCS